MTMTGQVAIVTGAGGGIGSEIVRKLAERGVSVRAWDVNDHVRRVADGINESVKRELVRAEVVDITDIPKITKKVDEVAEEAGRIDILVNNAGIMQTIPFMDIDETSWDRMLSVNLKSVFFLIQRAGRHMADRKSGAIVNISSIAGRSGRPLAAHYAASKAGVISLTRSAALEFGKHGVRVNAVCPGVIMTPMMEQINRERAVLFGIENEPDVAIRQFLPNIPLQRVGQARDVADVVVFLCTTEAGYIHGQAINVCGGHEMD